MARLEGDPTDLLPIFSSGTAFVSPRVMGMEKIVRRVNKTKFITITTTNVKGKNKNLWEQRKYI